MNKFIALLLLNRTHGQPNLRAIDDESEEPSAGQAAVEASPSHVVRLC